MKSFLLPILALCFCSLASSAQVYVEAPATLAFTITTSLDPVYTSKGATMSIMTTKVNNQDLLNECVFRGIISSTAGWNIVVFYDSVMDGPYTGSNPAFRLRNIDGRVVSIDTVLQVESVAVSGAGKASTSGTKVSGSIARRGLYKITANYQGYSGVFLGPVRYAMKLSGTTNEYYGTAGATTAVLNGYIEGDFDSTAVVSLKVGNFTRR